MKKHTCAILAISTMALTSNVQAQTLMHATIRSSNGEKNIYYDRTSAWGTEKCPKFPHYLLYLYDINTFDLSYDKSVPKNAKLKDLSDFTIQTSSYLKLCSYDEKTSVAKFKLLIKGGSGLYALGKQKFSNFPKGTSVPLMYGNGTLKLSDGTPAEFIIEGKIEGINGKTKWTSFHSNKYFDISIHKINITGNSFTGYRKNSCPYRIELIRLQGNVPVIVSTD